MSFELSIAELDSQSAELLPAREALGLLGNINVSVSVPTQVSVPTLVNTALAMNIMSDHASAIAVIHAKVGTFQFA